MIEIEPARIEPDYEKILRIKRERLRFRSHHRGTKEMDLLLGSFADRHIASFGLVELADYEQLLGEQDPDLYNWVTRQDTPPPEKQTAVLALFLQHQLVHAV